MTTLGNVIEAERQRAGVPGCAVAVVADGKVMLLQGFGHRDLASQSPVTPDTLFPIGSATKTFTAALLASLAEACALGLDAPVRTYVDAFALHDPVASEQVSMRDCLSHRTGLPRHDILWQAGNGVLTRADIVSALAHLPVNKPFRESYQYNNLLYIAAGELAGGFSGSSWEEAIDHRMLRPLAMTRTNFCVGGTQADADHATPYIRRANGDIEPTPFVDLGLAGPAGGINSCARDLVPWLLALTGAHSPALSTRTLTEMRTPAIAMPGDADAPTTSQAYGLGLMLEDHHGRRIAHHGGNIDGFSSQILTRDDGVGIAVLTNLHATWLRDSLPYLILDTLDGVTSPDYGGYFRRRLEARFAAADAARALPARSGLPPVRPLTDYAGRYRHPGYGELQVTHDGGSLAWHYRSLPSGPLRHCHLEVFEAHTHLNGVDVALPAQFTHDLAGDVDAMHVQLELMVRPIRFARV